MKKNCIAVKFRIKNIDIFLQHLRDHKYVLVGGAFEEATKYDFEDNRLSNNGIFLEIQKGFCDIITIAEKIFDLPSKNCLRCKSETFEIEDGNSMRYIFEKIGLTNRYIMEKYRIIWEKKSVTIHLDELPFGIYCEIFSSKKEIDKIIHDLNIEKTYNCTYWEIYDELNGNKKNIKFRKNHIFLTNALI